MYWSFSIEYFFYIFLIPNLCDYFIHSCFNQSYSVTQQWLLNFNWKNQSNQNFARPYGPTNHEARGNVQWSREARGFLNGTTFVIATGLIWQPNKKSKICLKWMNRNVFIHEIVPRISFVVKFCPTKFYDWFTRVCCQFSWHWSKTTRLRLP
jgi:hypothetical protein